MWNYEKRLEYPINIKRTDAAMAKAIISQFGGPDGETGAAMRYLSQRFAMPYRAVMGVLTDVGTEASDGGLSVGGKTDEPANPVLYKNASFRCVQTAWSQFGLAQRRIFI